MSDEVPPMPADLHERWMKAVREEAGQEMPAGTAGEDRHHTGTVVKWTRALGIAAVFVFLIGGTLIYRNSGKNLTDLNPVAAQNAVTEAEEKAAETAEDGVMAAAEPEVSKKKASGEAGGAPVLFAATAGEAAAPMAANVAVPEEAAEAYDQSVAWEAEEAYEPSAAYEADYAYEAADMAVQEEEEAEKAAAPAAAPLPTVGPTEAPETVREEPEKESLLSQAGAFLSDMGSFLLAALPYLAVLAVPAAAALIVRAGKKRRR